MNIFNIYFNVSMLKVNLNKRNSIFYLFIFFFFGTINSSLAQRKISILTSGWKFVKEDVGVMAKTDKWDDVTIPHTWNAIDGQAGSEPILDVFQNQVQAFEEHKKRNASKVSSEDPRIKSGYYRGTCWYSKNLEIPASWKGNKRVFIRYMAVSQIAKTYLNKNLLGEHRGAFTAFTYELTESLKYGQTNELRVEVDNSHREDIAPLSGDFNVCGGIYRPVELIVTENVCISPLFFATPGVFLITKSLDKNKALVEVKSYITNGKKPEESKDPNTEVIIETQIIDKSGKTIASGKKECTLNFETTIDQTQTLTIPDPTLWQGRIDPYLYQAKVRIIRKGKVIDEISQPLGLRTVAITKEKGFLLNGEVYPVYGVCRHQDLRDKGWALNFEDERADNRNLLEIGATAVRNAHYPQSQSWHDLADNTGILCWDEVSVVNETRDNRAFWESTYEQMRELCYQLYNHPSVVWWGLFNEIELKSTPQSEAQLQKLQAIAKEIDPNRIIVGASCRANRYFNLIPEQIAFNIYPGWYFGNWDKEEGKNPAKNFFEDYLTDRANETGKRIALSEYGAGGDIRHHTEGQPKKPEPAHEGPFQPEEWQTYVHERDWAVIKGNPALWGSFLWVLNDFAVAERNEGSMSNINTKGLITHDRRFKKDAFFFYKANWNPEPMVYITSRRSVERKQKQTQIKVYANVQHVELLVNGKSWGNVAPNDLKICIWKNVQLKQGINKIVVNATSNGIKLNDKCEWFLFDK